MSDKWNVGDVVFPSFDGKKWTNAHTIKEFIKFRNVPKSSQWQFKEGDRIAVLRQECYPYNHFSICKVKWLKQGKFSKRKSKDLDLCIAYDKMYTNREE